MTRTKSATLPERGRAAMAGVRRAMIIPGRQKCRTAEAPQSASDIHIDGDVKRDTMSET